MASSGQGSLQTAYQIVASSNPEKLAKGEWDIWDTGRVSSDETLWIEYADGQREVVGTDATWQCSSSGPIIRSTIFGGEIYDARRDIPDWYLPEADAGDAWQPVVVRPIDAAPASQIADFHARHYWPLVFSRNT